MHPVVSHSNNTLTDYLWDSATGTIEALCHGAYPLTQTTFTTVDLVTSPENFQLSNDKDDQVAEPMAGLMIQDLNEIILISSLTTFYTALKEFKEFLSPPCYQDQAI
jgi:hypothetical protein